MEDLPIQKSINIFKWLISLNSTKQLIAFLAAALIAVSTVAIRLYGTNATLNKENLFGRIEAEQRLSSSLQNQRDKDDSIRYKDRADCDEEKRQFYNRTPIIKQRNEKIEKALKK